MNRLSIEKRTMVLRCLIEGNSIRSTVRITSVAKNTILKLLVDAGKVPNTKIKPSVILPANVYRLMRFGRFVMLNKKMFPMNSKINFAMEMFGHFPLFVPILN